MSKPVPWATWKIIAKLSNLEQAMAQLGKNYSPSNIYNLIVKRSLFFFVKITKYKSSKDYLVLQR